MGVLQSLGSRARGCLSRRHSLLFEALAVVGFYALYEGSRGVVAGDAGTAGRHADQVIGLERRLDAFVEGDVQDAVHALPGLGGTLGFLYLALHLTVTGGVLLWLHRRRPHAFPFVRTTLLLASGLALVGYLAYPTAPPRLAGVGIADTVSNGGVDLNHGLISALYNPYAAVPSMHVGYAVIVGACLFRCGGRAALKAAGALYPVLVLLIVVSTGNHFLFDAVAGAAVAVVAAKAAALLAPAPEPARVIPLAPRHSSSDRAGDLRRAA
jgi:PAP2 superfamily